MAMVGKVVHQRGLFGIGAAGENGEGAVKLLGEHDTGKLVGESHCAEGELLLGTSAEGVRKAIGITAEEDEFAGAAVAKLGEPLGEVFGAAGFAGGVEEDDGGGAVGVEFLEGGGFVADFEDFDGGVAGDAVDVVVEEGAEFGAAGFAEHEETEAHGRVFEHKREKEEEKKRREKR
jgi:hypothetical protein